MLIKRIAYFFKKLFEVPIEEATHWVPKEMKDFLEGHITINKPYEILYDDVRDEYYMLDDLGENTAWWMGIKGYFIKQPKN